MPDTPLFETFATVQPAWIDYNGHMNMGYYLVAFDEIATDGWFDHIGIGLDHKAAENHSTFTLCSNIDYLREVMEGDALRITTQMLDWDHKRLHFIHTMYHADEGYIAATNECLSMYIDMETRRSTSFSPALQQQFAHILANDSHHPPSDRAGRTLGIRRR